MKTKPPEQPDTSKEQIVERIRKILSKVTHEGGATETPEAEIESALRFARKLMEKYNVSEQEVAEKPQGREALYDTYTTVEGYSRAGKIDSFDLYLARVPDIICGVGHYRTTKYARDNLDNFVRNKQGNLKNREVLMFYGSPRDIAVATALYKELLTTMRTMARFRLGGYTKEFPSYCEGFVDRLVERANAIKKESVAEAGTTAIVLVKGDLLKRKAEEIGLYPGKARRTRKIVDGVYEQGQGDANEVRLGTNGIGSEAINRRELPG